MRFARWLFLVAGVYGLLVLLPLFLGPARVARDYPPPITHQEFFFGFAGTALAWQIAFLVISRDPVRYRPLMLVGVVEKLIWGVAVTGLYYAGQVARDYYIVGLIDLVLGALFLVAWLRTPRTAGGS